MWKTIEGFPNYQVSDAGEIMSCKFGKKIILKPRIRSGYSCVVLCQNGERSDCDVHRLVLGAFIGECPEGSEANHLDGNKPNNRLDNLEWVTPSENMLHAYRNGLRVPPSNPNEKPIEQYMKDGQFVALYKSGCSAMRETGIPRGNISKCCTGKLFSAGGFVWRFAS